MQSDKKISTLQFITIDHPTISHSEQAIRAYNAGCTWVQLRMKNASELEIESEIYKILPTALLHNATLLINDNVGIAQKTKAHGVHLGKNDMHPKDARQILGDNVIIGGTANTLEDVLTLIEADVDYIGLGPFRFTTTKKNLSPTLGLNGYENIFNALKQKNINFPIVAIGGILENDIEAIRATGIHGIALAGAIVADKNIEENIKLFLQKIL